MLKNKTSIIFKFIFFNFSCMELIKNKRKSPSLKKILREYYNTINSNFSEKFLIKKINILDINDKNYILNKILNLENNDFKYFFFTKNPILISNKELYEQEIYKINNLKIDKNLKTEITNNLILSHNQIYDSFIDDKNPENNLNEFYLIEINKKIIALISYNKKLFYEENTPYNFINRIITFDKSINIFRYISAFCSIKNINLKIERSRYTHNNFYRFGKTLLNFDILEEYIYSKGELNLINLNPNKIKNENYYSFLIKPNFKAFLKIINKDNSFFKRIFNKNLEEKEKKEVNNLLLDSNINEVISFLESKAGKIIPLKILYIILEFLFINDFKYKLDQECKNLLFQKNYFKNLLEQYI